MVDVAHLSLLATGMVGANENDPTASNQYAVAPAVSGKEFAEPNCKPEAEGALDEPPS